MENCKNGCNPVAIVKRLSYVPHRWRPTAKKKAAVASGPKFREETPKKGNNMATPIAVLQC
jgi:hypothetical protein